VGIMRVAYRLANAGSSFEGALATRHDVALAGREVAPVASLGLKDADTEVRRLSAEALEQVAWNLADQIPQRRTPSEGTRIGLSPADVLAARAEMPPLIKVLREQ